MSYSSEAGYTPVTIETIMTSIMENVNTQMGTTYTYETFVGSGYYKFFYNLAQRLQENEVKTSEIFLSLQNYFIVTNERIQRPVVTNPGVIENLLANDYVASVKPTIEADAGKIYICVDVDTGAAGYAATKLAINTIIKNSVAGGIVTMGTETSTIVLSNGQSFDFKFYPPDRKTIKLKLTVTLSENNQSVILSPDEQKDILIDNIAARYALGKNFEPQRYFSVIDAPWASNVLLEWSDDDGANWHSTVYNSDFDELFVITLANVTLVEV